MINDGGNFPAIILDLIDNFNQSSRNGGTRDYPNDDVTGYTVEALNGIILGVYNASDLKTRLKAIKPNGVTNAQIDSLFVRYNSGWPN